MNSPDFPFFVLEGRIEAMQRYAILDALRGFALIGVVIVNAATINSPFWMDTSDFAFKSMPLDFLLTKFSFMFLVEKFYPIFALLFGLSAALSKWEPG